MNIRILYIDPSPMGLYDEHYQRLVDRHKEPGTAVDVVHLENLPEDLLYPFLPPVPFYYSEMFRVIHRAEADGYHAVIIGCSADPGLRDAANMVGIPVVGPLKAGLHLATLARRNVGVICPGHSGKLRPLAWHQESARLYGLERHVVGWRRATVERPPQAVIDDLKKRDPAALRDMIFNEFRKSVETTAMEQALRSIQEDGTEALYFGCTLWGGLLGPIARAVHPVPVIDPVIGALKVAEMTAKALLQARGAALD